MPVPRNPPPCMSGGASGTRHQCGRLRHPGCLQEQLQARNSCGAGSGQPQPGSRLGSAPTSSKADSSSCRTALCSSVRQRILSSPPASRRCDVSPPAGGPSARWLNVKPEQPGQNRAGIVFLGEIRHQGLRRRGGRRINNPSKKSSSSSSAARVLVDARRYVSTSCQRRSHAVDQHMPGRIGDSLRKSASPGQIQQRSQVIRAGPSARGAGEELSRRSSSGSLTPSNFSVALEQHLQSLGDALPTSAGHRRPTVHPDAGRRRR